MFHKKVAIIDNYDSFTFNLVELLKLRAFTLTPNSKWEFWTVRNDKTNYHGVKDFKPDYIIIGPGPGDANCGGFCKELFLEPLAPTLGVCLGIQIMSAAFGGKVIRAEKPIHGHRYEIYPTDLTKKPFWAARYHSLIVENDSLPGCFEITYITEDKTIMGLRHKTLPISGVQFHPESFLTENGCEIIDEFYQETL